MKTGRMAKPRGGLHRLLRNRLAMAGLGVVGVMVLLAVLAPLVTPHDPNLVDLDHQLLPPGQGYLLGTDQLGRDVFARLLYGGRVSMLVGFSGALGGAFLGIVFGCVGGYAGGWVDKVILRVSELLSTFPQMMLILVLVTFMGQGLFNLLIIFTLTGWTGIYRLVRARFFSIREENFVLALRAMRIPSRSIMFRHMLPNTMGPVIISITLSIAGYILAETGLSFLGMGVPSGVATWGNIINAAKSMNVITNYWWLWVPPGIAISLFVLGVNFFGDGLRDVLDPKQSRRG